MEIKQSDKQQKMQDENRRIQELVSKIEHKYVVMSGKGGVGKTTVAVNLAVALCEKGYHVGLMDVDFHGPNTLKMLGLEGQRLAGNGERLIPLTYGSNLKIISISSLLGNGDTAVVWRGPMKTGAIRQFTADVAWGELDFLIVDSPPGTGDEPLTVAQLIPGAQAIIVTTPQEVSILDIRKSITFSRQLSLPVAGVIENMSGLICPHCKKRIELFKAGGGLVAAQEMGVKFLGTLPIDPDVVTAGDEGKPYIISHPSNEISKEFSALVDRLLAVEHVTNQTAPSAVSGRNYGEGTELYS